MVEVPEDRDAAGQGRDDGPDPGNLLDGTRGSVSAPTFAGNLALSLAKGGVDRPTLHASCAEAQVSDEKARGGPERPQAAVAARSRNLDGGQAPSGVRRWGGGYGWMGTCGGRPPAAGLSRMWGGRGAVLSWCGPVSCHYAHLAPPTATISPALEPLREDSANGA
jgi:hypothetical protein